MGQKCVMKGSSNFLGEIGKISPPSGPWKKDQFSDFVSKFPSVVFDVKASKFYCQNMVDLVAV